MVTVSVTRPLLFWVIYNLYSFFFLALNSQVFWPCFPDAAVTDSRASAQHSPPLFLSGAAVGKIP